MKTDLKKTFLYLMGVALISIASITLHDAFEQEPLPQAIKSPSINRPFDFAGELVPVTNQDVRDRLDKELVMNTYLHGFTLLNLKMAGRYFPLIERILMEENIPDDFKYLVPVESNFSNATSPAGAKGFWQLMPSTAKELGLIVNDKIDERYNVELATRAACKFIKTLYNRFGNWTLVAAAYNGGGGRIDRELKAQKVNNFYDLYLNPETSKYIFRILAIKELMSSPSNFGYDIDQVELYKPLTTTRQIEVTEAIPDLTAFAIENGSTYRMLRYLNPWIIDRDLPATGKKLIILLP
ncbi:MAG TPA: lytic transglycosylase domain-containing protein [Saprospiraceae bacterium]|nr:lytic transglycosylase domain-containing protein [Saprospiraceae bacterium]HRP84637.1 lytic transglycosylase domain-containing protein [Saprospiraceae bacterium]